MFDLRKLGLCAAAVLALPAAGCATAQETVATGGPPAGYDEILPELPATAAPGECYAKVVVPGQPIAQPPLVRNAVWVLLPSGLGPGPVYCLTPNAPVPQPAVQTIAREGWIRVLCDADATPARIGRIQHELHDRGYYRGGYSGRYDRETVEAVTRFQAGAHIEHGGYLSQATVDALEHRGAAYPPAYAPPPVVAYGFQSGYVSGYQPGASYSYGPPVAYAPPLPPPVAASPYPCCVQAAPVYGSGYSESYASSFGYSAGGFGGVSVSSSVVQNGWLTWAGKSRF